MDIRKLQRTIVDALEDVKAQDIQVFNTEALTSLFDRVIIASGSSNRQTRALAASVRDKVREAGGEVKNPEGADSGEWVLVDCGDAVVHLMQPQIRAYYKLEDIWGGKTVHLKALQPAAAASAGAVASRRRGGAGTGTAAKPRSAAAKSSARGSRPTAAPAKSARAKSASAATGAGRSAPARSSTAKSAPAKSAATKSTAAKSAAAKSPAKSAVKPAAAKSAAAKAAPRRAATTGAAKPAARTKSRA